MNLQLVIQDRVLLSYGVIVSLAKARMTIQLHSWTETECLGMRLAVAVVAVRMLIASSR